MHLTPRSILLPYLQKQLIGKYFSVSEFPRIVEQLTPEIEDLFCLTIVHRFYKSNARSFKEFLARQRIEDIEQAAPRLYEIFTSFMGDIQQGLSRPVIDKLPHKGLGFIGDHHPSPLMRYYGNNQVVFQQIPYYDTFLVEFLSYFPELNKSLPRHTHKSGYTHREFIPVNTEAESSKAISDYYFLFGQLQSFLMLFRVIDINAENVIINMPTPVLFDLECMFAAAEISGQKYILDSTGTVQISPEFDVSAYTGGLFPVQSFLKPFLTGTLSKPIVKWEVPSKGKYYNIPQKDGTRINPLEYCKDVLKGIQHGQQIIKRYSKEIFDLVVSSEIGTRTIISPTRDYRILMQSYTFPQVNEQITFEEHYDNEIKNRRPIFQIQLHESIRSSELNALKSWQIPKYVSEIHSPEIYDSQGKVVAHYLETQFETWKRHFKDIDSLLTTAQQRLKEIYKLT